MNLKILNQADRAKVKQYLDKLPDNKQFDVTIRQIKQIRTMPQNRLYWLWLTCIMAETGNDKEDLHHYFAEKYLPKNAKEVLGTHVEEPISTRMLDTAQFTKYLERVQQFANAELGIALPNPEDLHWKDFYEQYKNFI